MPNIDDLDQTITRILRTLGCDAPVIAPVHHLSVDLGIDSTELIELALIIRDELGLKIKPDLSAIVTVSDLTAEAARLIASERNNA